VRIVATSDLHGTLPEVPPCDVLIVAGDICPVSMPHDPATQHGWLDTNFRAWLMEEATVKAPHVIGIAGNHDFVFEAKEHPRDLPWTYLQDSGCEIGGLKFWGTPRVPKLRRWAFYGLDSGPGGQGEAHISPLSYHFDKIPDDTDVLITHGPAKGVGDHVPEGVGGAGPGGEHCGAKALREAVLRVRPRLHVWGHIHEGHGRYLTSAGTEGANVALLDGSYAAVHKPLPFTLD
jgi:Icc-related predicted phosphoesterase